MTKLDDEIVELLDGLEPVEVTTSGPAESDTGDQDDLAADHTAVASLMSKVGDDDDGDAVRGVRGAIAWARHQVRTNSSQWQGMCLMFVRMCFNVDPLYPDAITAWEQAKDKHRVTMANAQRGHAGYLRGGKHGHVLLCLGDGRAFSSDVRTPGQVDMCNIADLARAWGYTWLGTTSDINGELAPAPRKRKRISNRQWRLTLLRSARTQARQNGNQARVVRLTKWIKDVR